MEMEIGARVGRDSAVIGVGEGGTCFRVCDVFYLRVRRTYRAGWGVVRMHTSCLLTCRDASRVGSTNVLSS
jgi:hypothetical protein